MLIELIIILIEVINIAAIIRPIKTPEKASPLELKESINVLKEPVTKVTRQKIMSSK